MRRNRSSFSFPDFSLRRLLLQGARAARGSPTLGNRCDIEKGPSSSSKGEKSTSTSSSKVSVVHRFFLPFRFAFCARGTCSWNYISEAFVGIKSSAESFNNKQQLPSLPLLLLIWFSLGKKFFKGGARWKFKRQLRVERRRSFNYIKQTTGAA